MGQIPEDKVQRIIIARDQTVQDDDNEPTTDQTINTSPAFAVGPLLTVKIDASGGDNTAYIVARIWAYHGRFGWIQLGDERINQGSVDILIKQISDFGIHSQTYGITFPTISAGYVVNADVATMSRQSLI